MLTTLDVPYVNTSAAELVWTLDHPAAAALTSTVVPLSRTDGEVVLRVLGASHQVALRRTGTEIVETVACLPGFQPNLPAAVAQSRLGRRYRFQSRVEDVGARELRGRVRALRRMAEQDAAPVAMVLAAFPAELEAVTALRLAGDTRGDATGVRWDTWHVYPNSGQIVTTSTEVL